MPVIKRRDVTLIRKFSKYLSSLQVAGPKFLGLALKILMAILILSA